jgi:hypothetical protein
MSEKRRAYFNVSYELIADLLKLPQGHEIKRISCDFSGRDDIAVVVEGPDLPVAEREGPLPRVNPIYQKNEDGTVKFIGWK